MEKEKWVVKFVTLLEALSHRCMSLKYVTRPFICVLSIAPVSWMAWFSTTADLSHVMPELEQLLKLEKLKDRALVHGVSREKKVVIVKM